MRHLLGPIVAMCILAWAAYFDVDHATVARVCMSLACFGACALTALVFFPPHIPSGTRRRPSPRRSAARG